MAVLMRVWTWLSILVLKEGDMHYLGKATKKCRVDIAGHLDLSLGDKAMFL